MIKSKLLVKNISASLLFKVASIIIGILTIPAYLTYFEDKNLLGGWFTLLALLNWLLFFDLGLGNGLKNELIIKLANSHYTKAKQYIYSSYLVLLALSILIITVLYGVYLYNPFHALDPQGGGTSISNIDLVILATVSLVFIQFPLRLVISILLAMQKSAIANSLPFVTQLLVLIFLLFCGDIESDNKFLILTLAYGVAFCAPLVIATIYVFTLVSKWPEYVSVKPRLSVITKLIFTGSKFFWIQLCLLVLNGSNEFLILSINNAENVVHYQVYFKVFSVFLIAFSTLTIPLWSAIGQAKALKNNERILKINKYMKLILLVSVLGMVTLCFLLPYIFNLWLGEKSVPHNYQTSVIFSVYIFVMMGINYSACIANGFNKIGVQVKCMNLAVILKFSILYIFLNYVNKWSDIIVITILALLPALVIQYVFSQRILMSNKGNR